jgi:hypothetical protein
MPQGRGSVMKHILIVLLLFAGSISLMSREEAPGDALPGLSSPNGLKLNLVNGFESWRLVSSHVRVDKNEMHYIWGNDRAMNAIKSAGAGEPVYGAGSVFVKVGYRMRKNPLFMDSIEPAGLQRVEFMVKDPRRFADTGGWGYARFPYDGAGGSFSVYGKAPDFANECYSCHLRAGKSDFVFTKHMNYAAGPNEDAVSLAVGSSSSARFPLWKVHPSANIAAFIIFLCGICIARYLKRKQWWTRAHAAFQAGGIAVLAAGISAMIAAIGQGRHFNVPHAYLGLATLAVLLLTACGGVIALTVPSITKTVRPIHRWAGRISAIMLLLTIVSGIIMSFAGH